MLLNTNLNDTYQKILWVESGQTCKRVINIIATTGGRKGLFQIFYRWNPKLLVCSESLGVLSTSKKGKRLRNTQWTRRTITTWLDTLKNIQETCTSCTTHI